MKPLEAIARFVGHPFSWQSTASAAKNSATQTQRNIQPSSSTISLKLRSNVAFNARMSDSVRLSDRKITQVTRNDPLIGEMWLGSELASAFKREGHQPAAHKAGAAHIKITDLQSSRGFFTSHYKFKMEYLDAAGKTLKTREVDETSWTFLSKKALSSLAKSFSDSCINSDAPHQSPLDSLAIELHLPNFSKKVEASLLPETKPSSSPYLLTQGANPVSGNTKHSTFTVQHEHTNHLIPVNLESNGSASLKTGDGTDFTSRRKIFWDTDRTAYCVQLSAEASAKEMAEKIIKERENLQ